MFKNITVMKEGCDKEVNQYGNAIRGERRAKVIDLVKIKSIHAR